VDCEKWTSGNFSWAAGGCVGGGEASILLDESDGYMYQLIEAPDKSLGCLGRNQNWVLGLSRARSFLPAGQWEPFHASPTVVPRVKQGCYIQYHRLFRDRTRGATYLEFWADNWMQVHRLVPEAGRLPIVAGVPPPTEANCTTNSSCMSTCEGVATCPADGTVYCCADTKHCGGQHACPGNAGLLGCACKTVPRRAPQADKQVYFADSMTNVMRGLNPPTPTTKRHHIGLAANEFEGIQLVVRTGDAPLANLTWSVSAPDTSGLEIIVQPIGFVHSGRSEGCPMNVTSNPKCTKPTPIDCGDGVCRERGKFACRGCSEMGPVFPTETDWWPYLVLDFVDAVDVAPRTSQPLLLTAHTAADAPAANHTIIVTLVLDTLEWTTVELTVEVFGFALPSTPSLPTFWGVSERDNVKLWPAEATTLDFSNRFADFLLDHRIAASGIYGGAADWPTQYTIAGLRRLYARGQRNFNLASLQVLPVTQNETAAFYAQVASAIQLTDAAGIPRNATSVYVLDESPADVDAVVLPLISKKIKALYGGGNGTGVQVVTCGSNQWLLRRNGSASFPNVDIFLPPLAGHVLPGQTCDGIGACAASFANSSKKAKAAVAAAGQRLGLYTSGFPGGKDGLNWKVELPVIRSRILLGLAAFSDGVEAFLYYRLNKWTQYVRSSLAGAGGHGPLNLTSVTPTMEVKGFAYAPYGHDGMGELIAPGPFGALSTIHFENIRDGLEDHTMLSMLQTLVIEKEAQGVDCKVEAALLRAPGTIWCARSHTSFCLFQLNMPLLLHAMAVRWRIVH
jgi:hypothetical protein